jgi:hypothetical protein
MKLMDLEDWVYYRANCGCGSDECGLTLELEYDPDLNDVTLNIYQKMIYCSWWGVNSTARFYWFKDMWHRIKGALKLLFTGRIQLEESFLFKGDDHVDAFITAIQEGREKVKKAAAEKSKE